MAYVYSGFEDIFHVLIIASLIITVIVYWKREKSLHRVINKLNEKLLHKEESLKEEKEKNEKFLQQIIPSESKPKREKVNHQKFEMVTVLFCDIEGFTKIAELLNPEVLIDKLDDFFFQFDSVVEKYNIEKIKTIGDAYMCAGGIPKKNSSNPVEVILAALEILEYMRSLRENDESIWDLRIGIHTGPVIGGIIGQKKLSYDIWGDTVNTASRMESSGVAGKINVSDQTYKLVKDYFICEYRGKMPVKYKGKIDMYFVKGLKPVFKDTKNPNAPNSAFFIKIQLLRFNDLEEEIIEIFSKDFLENLHYHNLKHTHDLLTKAELYGQAENLKDEDLLILKTTAILYDIIYIKKNIPEVFNEINAEQILDSYKYSTYQKSQILSLAKIVGNPFKAKTKLEKILLDAEYDYLGRSDYIDVIKNKYNELKFNNLLENKNNWINNEIYLVNNYPFYTNTAKTLKEINSPEQISALKNLF